MFYHICVGTHVFLSTPVAPPIPSEHLKTYNEEKENEAWEEFFSDEYNLPYWVNDITKESTWVEPGPVKFSRVNLSFFIHTFICALYLLFAS